MFDHSSYLPGGIRILHDKCLSLEVIQGLLVRNREDPAGDQLKGGRNIVSRQMLDGVDCCIKDYALRNVQPWIYRWRSSKAFRAARAVGWLKEIGIESPEPLAVIEQFEGVRMKRVILITRYESHDWSLRELYDSSDWEPYLQHVGTLLKTMHENGLVHRDNTPGNIVIRKGDPASYFVIDINRIRRARMNDKQALYNIALMGFVDEQLKVILSNYRPDASVEWQNWAYNQTISYNQKIRAHFARKRQRRMKRRAKKGMI